MDYKDARIQALEAEVKRLNEIIKDLNSMGVRLTTPEDDKSYVNDPVFSKPVSEVFNRFES